MLALTDRSTLAPFNTDISVENVHCTQSGCHPKVGGEGHHNMAKSKPAYTQHDDGLQCHPSDRGGG